MRTEDEKRQGQVRNKIRETEVRETIEVENGRGPNLPEMGW